jgi:general secretion pathway protein B
MSLILDALRKMEKDRNSRRGAALDIRPEVLRYRAAAKPQRTRLSLPVVLGIVLLVGVGAGFFLKGNRAANVSEPLVSERNTPAAVLPATPTAPDRPAPAASSATPAMAVMPVASNQPAVSASAVPAAIPATPAVPAVAMPVATRKAAPRSVSVPVPGASPGSHPERQPVAARLQARPETDRAAQSRLAHREAAVTQQAAPADITITGIAWQDERSLRRAVVNGALVGEGAEVAGARVLEIREDRVRLSRGGQVFDAVFSSGFSR